MSTSQVASRRCEPIRNPCCCKNLRSLRKRQSSRINPLETTQEKQNLSKKKKRERLLECWVCLPGQMPYIAEHVGCPLSPRMMAYRVSYCGADPGNWDTWSPWLTHSYYRFWCSRICGSYSKGSSRAIWKVSLWYVLAGKESGRDFTKSISCVALLNLCRCTLPQIFCLNWSGCFLCVLGSLRFPSIFALLKRNLFYNCDKNIT